jgi:hypothetical protein
MKNEAPRKAAHKLGANRKEAARKAKKRDPNFAQSRDIREDRGERKMKSSPVRQVIPRAGRSG